LVIIAAFVSLGGLLAPLVVRAVASTMIHLATDFTAPAVWIDASVVLRALGSEVALLQADEARGKG
jgi:hypothetical protein